MKFFAIVFMIGVANSVIFPMRIHRRIGNILWTLYLENYQMIHYNDTIDHHLLMHNILA